MTGAPVSAIRSAWDASVDSLGSTVGVGIDLVEVASFTNLVATGGSAFLNTGWSPQEQLDAGGSPERLAARWAAKESIMKALQLGIGDLDPLDIEVLTDPDGSPRVVLHGNALVAAATREVSRWHLSLCHEEGWAVAIAIADRSPSASSQTQQDEGNRDG